MAIFDRLFAALRGAPVQRTPEAQARVDAETAALCLYHFGSCPYCLRVRNRVGRLGLRIVFRDIRREPAARAELVQGGGKDQVPCLFIRDPGNGDRWLYESADIVRYLEQRFG